MRVMANKHFGLRATSYWENLFRDLPQSRDDPRFEMPLGDKCALKRLIDKYGKRC